MKKRLRQFSPTNGRPARKGLFARKRPVKLGLLSPLSGVAAIYGDELVLAARIAVMEVNEQGGVLGRPLHLIIEDDGCHPEMAVRAGERLIDQHGCVALVGNLLSNARIAVTYRVAESRRVPLLNFSFYEGSIFSRYFFHFAALPNQQIDRMIPWMKERYGLRMFFAGNGYEWPRGSIAAAKEVLLRIGGTVSGEEYLPISLTHEQIDRLLHQLMESGADVFVPYFVGSDQMRLLTRFSTLGLKNRIAVVMGHFDERMASHLPPEVRQGFYASNTYFMSLKTKDNIDFLNRLSRMPRVRGIWPDGNGIVTHFGEGVYLCVKAFAQAVNQVGELGVESLVEALENVSISSPQGTVRMDPETHHARVQTFLTRCDAAGRFELIREFGPVDPVIPEKYVMHQVDVPLVCRDDQRLQALMLENMTEGVCLVRASDAAIVYVNRGFERLFGYARGEILERNIEVIYEPVHDDSVSEVRRIATCLLHKGEWVGETRNIRKDGTPFWGYVSITSLTHPVHGELWMVILQDISERKRNEEALRGYKDTLEEQVRLRTLALERARDDAEAAARAKESFLFNMSHEIRTPMNGVLGMADLILETSLTEQQRHYVNTIHRSGRLLLRIINDILDFAKIRSGQFHLEIIYFSLNDVLKHIRELFEQQASAKGLHFRFQVRASLPEGLLGDPYRLDQILFNLLGNAVKFTETGSITLSVEVEEEREVDLVLRFLIADSGIGISPEYLERIFQSFSQEDSSVARRFGGSGLGLAISRQLVLLMNGRLWVESAPGVGSTFGFTARFGKMHPGIIPRSVDWNRLDEPDSRESGVFLGGLEGRILLVEDNVVNQEVALAALRLFGCEVTVEDNGLSALERLKSAPEQFDLILMDCEMPIMDGFETTRRVRQWELAHARPPMPIVALTAHVLQESRQKCLASGMNDHLRKPFSLGELGAMVRHWLPPVVRGEPVGDPEPTQALQSGDTGGVLDDVALERIMTLARKGDSTLPRRMVAHYMEQTRALLGTLSEAVAKGDGEAVRVAAHSLKSSSLTMGVVGLAAMGREMEANHSDLERVGRCVAACARLYDQAGEALNAVCGG
ncbi:Sensor histidine kinase RcsC [Candidatus Magnetaquicoccaceae bacterium FCR-1]|uniref:histidine kinase n=1 Tax=Candidatus Magnetaquiglobus chichijimensis TaxID=3141448 RepID=A0ABQ0C7U9_9PROT